MNYLVYLRFSVTLLSCYISSGVYALRFLVQATIQGPAVILTVFVRLFSAGSGSDPHHVGIAGSERTSLSVKLKLRIEGDGYTFASGTKVATLPLTPHSPP